MLIGGKTLRKTDFSMQAGAEEPAGSLAPSGTLVETEKTVIEEALAKAEGNLTQASRILGITRQTLYRRMEKYSIKP